MEVIAREEQGLPDYSLITLAEERNGFSIPGSKNVGEGAVYSSEVSKEFGFLT